MRAIARRLWYALWTLNGYVGRHLSLDTPQKLTVLITYYSPARLKHIEPQVRNFLKCDFVDRLVISSHNPDIHVDDIVKIKDKRLVLMNQAVRRGCGYRWSIAADLDPEYLIVVDDDVLLFPLQLAKLFKHLVNEPEAPHGFTGFVRLENGVFEHHQGENMVVDYLCEIYAVTRSHLKRYGELKKLLGEHSGLRDMIESSVDFMVISQSGTHRPRIHKVFRLFRSDTFREIGVAVHREDGFYERMSVVGQALSSVSIRDGRQAADGASVSQSMRRAQP